MGAKKLLLAVGIALILLLGAVPLVVHFGLAPRNTETAPLPIVSLMNETPPPSVPSSPPTPAVAVVEALPPPVDLDAADRDRDLFGIVTNGEGQPIAGVRVETRFHDGRRLSLNDQERFWQSRSGPATRSAADGTFSLKLKRGEVVELVISHSGFARCSLPQRQAGEFVEAVLRPASRLEVVARNEQGEPVPAVRLRLWAHDATRPGGSIFGEREGVTGTDGRFVFADLEPGKVTLSLEHTVLGSPAWQFPVVPERDAVVLDVVMPAGRAIRGRVTDAATGEAIAGARVGANWTLDRPVSTDAEGVYTFGGWTGDGVEDLHVITEGYGRQGKLVPPQGDVDFSLVAGGRAVGRVLDSRGKPIAGAIVTAIASRIQERQETDSRLAVTGVDGRFTLTSLRVDLPHTLVVVAPGHGRYLLDFDHGLADAGAIDLEDIVVPDSRAIEGTALDANRDPIPGATVILVGENQDRNRLRKDFGPAVDGGYGSEESRRTDDLGRFRFPDLSPGGYSLTLQVHGFPSVSTGVNVPEDCDLLDVQLSQAKGGSLRVRVNDSKGAPLEGIRVEASSEAGRSHLSGVTEANGRAEFHGLPDSSTKIHVSPGNRYLSPNSREEMPRGQEIAIVLEEAALIEGVLLSPDGEPLAEHEVRAVAAGGSEEVASSFSDGEGQFSVKLRPGARVDLEITGISAARSPRPVDQIGDLRGELRGVTAPSGGVAVTARRIALDRWMVVEVVGPDGSPIAGVALWCWGRGVGPWSRRAETDEAGRAVLKDLPPESLRVTVQRVPTRVSEVRLQHPQPVDAVPEGQTLRLQFGEKVEGRK